MELPSIYPEVSYCHIESLLDNLELITYEYRKLALTLLSDANKKKQNKFRHILDLRGADADFDSIVKEEGVITFFIPKPFYMQDFSIDIGKAYQGTVSIVYPVSISTTNETESKSVVAKKRKKDTAIFDEFMDYCALVAKSALRSSALGGSKVADDFKEYLSKCLFLPANQTIPEGYLASGQFIIEDRASAEAWLVALGSSIDYCIAIFEPMLRYRVYSPTLGACNDEASGYIGWDSAVVKPPTRREAIIEVDRRYREFQIVLNELWREGVRRSEQDDEIKPTGCNRTRMNQRDRTAMYNAVVQLSAESDDRVTARDVHERMCKIDNGATQHFDPTRIAHGKAALTKEPYNLEFVGRNRYRLTPRCLAQILPKSSNNKKSGGKKSTK